MKRDFNKLSKELPPFISNGITYVYVGMGDAFYPLSHTFNPVSMIGIRKDHYDDIEDKNIALFTFQVVGNSSTYYIFCEKGEWENQTSLVFSYSTKKSLEEQLEIAKSIVNTYVTSINDVTDGFVVTYYRVVCNGDECFSQSAQAHFEKNGPSVMLYSKHDECQMPLETAIFDKTQKDETPKFIKTVKWAYFLMKMANNEDYCKIKNITIEDQLLSLTDMEELLSSVKDQADLF